MKQHLRSLWTLLLLMMWCSVGFAQTTIWSEDWTGCKSGALPKNINSNYSSKNNGTKIYTGKDDKYAGGTPPELLIKKGDALVVKVTDLKGCSGTFTLNYSSNRPSSTLVVSANGSTIKVSGPTNDTKYTGTFNIKEGTTEIELKFSASENSRIDDIKLTGTLVESKPTLTFSETEKTVYKGSESSFTMPTLVLKDKDGKEVTTGVDYLYEVTDANPEGCLDVDMITGKITFNELGTANIKVTTSTTDSGSEFNNLTASYILNYKKVETTLTLSKTSVSVNLGETPELPTCTLKAGDEIITNKTLSYTITPEGIANINPTTGELTLISAGKATVSVSFTGDETYEASNIASYKLTVVDPNAPLENIVFDATTKGFDDIKLSKQYSETEETATFKAENGKTYPFTYSNCMRYNDSNYNPDVIQMRNRKGKGSFTSPVFDEMPNGYKVNVYYGITMGKAPLTITSNEESSATSISNAYGEDDINNGTGYCTSIILSNGSSFTVKVGGSTCYVSKIEIIPLSAPITLEEDATDNDTKIAKNNGKTQDVALTRTLVANKWNTFCVPFETELAGTALEGATVKAVGEVVGNVINLVDATKIEAGVPYLVMPKTNDIKNPTFKGVTITEISAKDSGNDEYKFVGTYSPKPINKGEFGTIWGVTAEGKLAKINAGTTMKGLRAYFVFPTNTPAAKLNFNGETTGINNIETNATVNGKVYNLNGQYVGNSLNGLKKGIYVVNGKKVIK